MVTPFDPMLQVVSFEDITKGGGMSIHRPIVCSLHGEEHPMKYFCSTCQILICNECVMMDHKTPSHDIERCTDIAQREVDILNVLIQHNNPRSIEYSTCGMDSIV